MEKLKGEWIKKVPPPPTPHICEMPTVGLALPLDVGIGSEWRCFECRKEWVLAKSGFTVSGMRWSEKPKEAVYE